MTKNNLYPFSEDNYKHPMDQNLSSFHFNSASQAMDIYLRQFDIHTPEFMLDMDRTTVYPVRGNTTFACRDLCVLIHDNDADVEACITEKHGKECVDQDTHFHLCPHDV